MINYYENVVISKASLPVVNLTGKLANKRAKIAIDITRSYESLVYRVQVLHGKTVLEDFYWFRTKTEAKNKQKELVQKYETQGFKII